MSSKDPFRLKKVCAHCPFRADEPFHGLDEERVSEIADSLRDGGTFYCHSTLDYGLLDDLDDEDQASDGMSAVTRKSQFCAGAMATMEKEGKPNQIMRIGERLGLYDSSAFDAEAQPVYDSLDEWEQTLVERDQGDRAARRA